MWIKKVCIGNRVHHFGQQNAMAKSPMIQAFDIFIRQNIMVIRNVTFKTILTTVSGLFISLFALLKELDLGLILPALDNQINYNRKYQFNTDAK